MVVANPVFRIQAVDASSQAPSIKLDSAGRPVIAYRSLCTMGLRLARPQTTLLHRGVVLDLATGWRASALPLSAANDDETAPFPFATALGAATEDTIVTAAPLTLYRLLLDGASDTGNVLRAAKGSDAVELHY